MADRRDQHIANQLAHAQRRIAPVVRQYFRAQAAADRAAMEYEADFICHRLEQLLSAHLRSEASWDFRKRWTDGMIGAQLATDRPSQMRIIGQMVWGLIGDAGGPQWAEAFEADLELAASGELRSYALRFCNQPQIQTKLVTPGAYATLANAQGEVEFRPSPHATTSAPATPAEKPAGGRWLYQFAGGGGGESEANGSQVLMGSLP